MDLKDFRASQEEGSRILILMKCACASWGRRAMPDMKEIAQKLALEIWDVDLVGGSG